MLAYTGIIAAISASTAWLWRHPKDSAGAPRGAEKNEPAKSENDQEERARAFGFFIHELREVDAGEGGFFLVVDEPYLDRASNATIQVAGVSREPFGWTAQVEVQASDGEPTVLSLGENSTIAISKDGRIHRLVVGFVNSVGVVFRRAPVEAGAADASPDHS